jgi:hypothetical protein
VRTAKEEQREPHILEERRETRGKGKNETDYNTSQQNKLNLSVISLFESIRSINPQLLQAIRSVMSPSVSY